MRCDPATDVPNDLHVQYYSERGQSAGLVSTECVYVSEHGDCFPGGAGIINKDQIEGWKRVTKAVHDKDGLIFLQAYHCGRAGHPDNFGGRKAIAPSPIPIRGKVWLNGVMKYHEVPEEMKTADVLKVIQEFATAAKNTAQAGFDGIELHGANGYIIDQFWSDSTNERKDEYGGSIENRCRMPLAVIDEFIKVFGADRVGIKMSPVGRYNDMYDSDPLTHYSYLLKELTRRSIGYAIVMDESFVDEGEHRDRSHQIENCPKAFRKDFKGTMMMGGGLTLEKCMWRIDAGEADLGNFGRLFLANPDLVERFKNGWPLNEPDKQTFYGAGPKGYTDYPKYEAGRRSDFILQ